MMNVKCGKCRFKFDIDIHSRDGSEQECVCPRCGNKFTILVPEHDLKIVPAPVSTDRSEDIKQLSPATITQPILNEEPTYQSEPTVVQYQYDEDDSNGNRLGLIVAIVLGVLAILGIGGWLWYDSEMKRTELERQLAIQAEQARQDSIARAEEMERVRQDSIRQAQERERVENARASYIALLDRYNARYGDGYPNCYFLYDITGDGMPELWIESGTCEADYEMHIYTLADGVAKMIHSTDYSHASCYKGDNYIIITHCHMGYAYWYKISFDGSKIVEKKVFDQELAEDEYEYTEPDETYVSTYLQTEHDPINAYIK